MQVKLKVKLIKYKKNLFNVVISSNAGSSKSKYIEKIGVCFFFKNIKVIMLSLKRLSYWLNSGVILTDYVSYLATNIFRYYLNVNFKKLKKNVIFIKK